MEHIKCMIFFLHKKNLFFHFFCKRIFARVVLWGAPSEKDIGLEGEAEALRGSGVVVQRESKKEKKTENSLWKNKFFL